MDESGVSAFEKSHYGKASRSAVEVESNMVELLVTVS